MKKALIFSIITLSLSLTGYSQMLTFDSGNATIQAIIKGLEEANGQAISENVSQNEAQKNITQKTQETLEKYFKSYEEVSSKVKNFGDYNEIIESQKELISLTNKVLRNLSNSKYLDSKEKKCCKALIILYLNHGKNLYQDTKALTTSNNFKMQDGDRIKMLMDINERFRETIHEFNTAMKVFEDLISYRLNIEKELDGLKG